MAQSMNIKEMVHHESDRGTCGKRDKDKDRHYMDNNRSKVGGSWTRTC